MEPLPKRATRLRKVQAWLAGRAQETLTTEELARFLGDTHRCDATATRRVAQLLVAHGVLQRRLPGAYRVLRPGAPPPPPLTAGEILDHWLGWEGYALGYGTAMALHGLAPAADPRGPLHLLRAVPCARLPPRTGLDLREHQRCVRALEDLVRVADPALGTVTARSPVRTALDACEHPEWAGGIARVAAYLDQVLARSGAEALAGAADGSVRRQGICRLGYLLERAGAPEPLLRPLRARAAGGFHLLEPGAGPGPLEKGWRLRLNALR